MNIDLTAAPQLLRGAAEICRTSTGICPHRFANNLDWGGDSPFMKGCSSGIRLHCQTDAQALELNVELGESLFEFGRGVFDLWVDRQPQQSFQPLPPWLPGQHFQLRYFFSPGEHEVLLYFPSYRQVTIKSFQLPGATFCHPAPPARKKFFFIGDSIVQGYAATGSMSYVARLSRIFNADFHNLGIGGAEMPHGLPFARDNFNFDLALIAFGVNDVNHQRPLADFRVATAETLDFFAALPALPTLVLAPLFWPQARERHAEQLLSDVRQVLAEEVAKRRSNLHFVNGLELLPSDTSLFPDAIHPNAIGMAQIAASLAQKIATITGWLPDDR